MALYISADQEIEIKKDEKSRQLPELNKGVLLDLKKIEPKQHFTMPPPRFSEASLVKELEENGIGRPSTYATILSTIKGKGYVEVEKGYFRPSELGFIVNDLLVLGFPNLFSVEFTAKLEDGLDSIETSSEKYQNLLSKFYATFSKGVDAASEGMLSMRGVGFATGIACPECEKQLHLKVGKNGHYIGCSGYPECRFTTNYTRDEKGKIQLAEQVKADVSDKVCDKCGKPMLIKSGQYGKFIACSGYPNCKNTLSVDSNGYHKETGVNCPKEKCEGRIVEKKSRRGRLFYSCNRYPECSFAIWEKPVSKKCPDCGAEFLVEKTTKKAGTFLTCITPKCSHKE
jgi:DNA topoisomerase-1